MEFTYGMITFSDEDVAELDDWIPSNESNPHNVRPWLLHDHGSPVCVVFGSSLQEALDAAVDADKLDRYLVSEQDLEDYKDDEGEPTCSFLGNAGEPFDIDTMEVIELPNPPTSWVAVFAASRAESPDALQAASRRRLMRQAGADAEQNAEQFANILGLPRVEIAGVVSRPVREVGRQPRVIDLDGGG